MHLLKTEERPGSGEVEHGGGWVGENGFLLMRGGDRKFLMIYWGGGQNFSTSHHKK